MPGRTTCVHTFVQDKNTGNLISSPRVEFHVVLSGDARWVLFVYLENAPNVVRLCVCVCPVYRVNFAASDRKRCKQAMPVISDLATHFRSNRVQI